MLKHCQIVWFLQLTQNIKTRVVYEWPASNTHVVFASGTSIDWQDNKRTRNALFKDDASDKADSKEWQAWRRTSTQGGVRCVRCSNMWWCEITVCCDSCDRMQNWLISSQNITDIKVISSDLPQKSYMHFKTYETNKSNLWAKVNNLLMS